METELTREIKRALHAYSPKMPSSMRTVRYADEVWTPHGIVDVIRFEDYILRRDMSCRLIDIKNQSEDYLQTLRNIGRIPRECKFKGLSYPNDNCKGCIYNKLGPAVTDMMVSAYEVKISKADFRSIHGHSVDRIDPPIGNECYYCVPKEIVKDIENTVPAHVGILTYHGHGYVRKYRDAMWMDVPDSTKVMLLYNALKKWCDGRQ